MMEIAFIRPRKITFDRYVFFSRKQKEWNCRTILQYFERIGGKLWLRNSRRGDNQRHLHHEYVEWRYSTWTFLRDTVDPERALSIAVNMEMGHQNQQRISSNNNNNNHSATGRAINAIQSFNRFRGANSRGNQSGRVAVNRAAPIALQNMTITIGNTDCHLLPNSGSGCTIINMSLAKEKMFNCAQSQWPEKKSLELNSFSNDIVETLGTLKTPTCCNDWKIQKAKITVVADRFRPTLGRDLFDQLGITILQKPCPNIEINNIETPCAMNKSLATNFRN